MEAVLEKYQLQLMRGITLVGVPGVGKTLFAKATANYLAGCGEDARFIHVKPGSLRGIYYGQAESRIRELFATAKAARFRPGSTTRAAPGCSSVCTEAMARSSGAQGSC